jgi:hypothetical protein
LLHGWYQDCSRRDSQLRACRQRINPCSRVPPREIQQLYIHVNIMQLLYTAKMLSRGLIEWFVCNIMFLLCWRLTLLCHVSNEKGVLSAHVSSIAAGSLLPPIYRASRWARLGLGHCPLTHSSRASFLYSWIQAIPWYSVRNKENEHSSLPARWNFARVDC